VRFLSKEEKINVKEIINSIKTKIDKENTNLLSNDSNHVSKSYLEKLVSQRKKTFNYKKTEKFLFADTKQTDSSHYTNYQLEHFRRLTNESVNIEQRNPILSNRNKIIRSLALKIRNTIQDEIRFTLDPIIQNQVQYNHNSVNTLNIITKFLHNLEESLKKQIDMVEQIQDDQNILKENISHTISDLQNEISRLWSEVEPDVKWEYLEFENKFRGSEEIISNNQLNYLPIAEKAFAKISSGYLIDVGCGRGEFLQLLKNKGFAAKGVENNPIFVEYNMKRDRNVIQSDINNFLNVTNDNSLVGITAFQVIEHFSPSYLLSFFNLAFQKIAVGGVIILETVNPMSLFSLMHYWYDLSHKKPLPPEILKFYLEKAGFSDIEINFVNEVPSENKLSGDDENTKKLNQILFHSQDYNIIGWKQ